MINEVLTNVVKHASATTVTIEADRHEGLWWIMIRDDGHGGATMGAGRGLSALAARAEAVNGALTVDSPVGGPTEVRMRCPI